MQASSPDPCSLVFPPLGGERKGRGIDVRGQGRLLLLPEEVEARFVFPLGTGQANAVLRNPGPLDAVVGGPYKINFHSTIRVPADM